MPSSSHHDPHFSDLRALLQRPGTSLDWREVCAILMAVLSDQGSRSSEAFFAQYGDYISSSLDAWPDEIRTATWDAHPYIKSLARVMRFEFSSGYKSKRSYEQLCARREPGEPARYTSCVGLEIASNGLGSGGDVGLPMLCDVLAPKLAHIWITFQNAEDLRRGRFDVETMCATLDALLTSHGPSLHSLGVGLDQSFEDADAYARLWEVVGRHAHRMTRLRALYGLGILRGGEALCQRIVTHPALQLIETLALTPSDSSHIPVEALTLRPGASTLRHIKLGHITREDIVSLLRAPELEGVERWEFGQRNAQGVFYSPSRTWYEARTLYWRAWQHKLTAPASSTTSTSDTAFFKQPILSSTAYVLEDFLALLFDEEDHLHSSEHVTQIHFRGALDPHGHIAHFFEQAARAYPNLKVLTFDRPFGADALRAMGRSLELLDALDTLLLSIDADDLDSLADVLHDAAVSLAIRRAIWDALTHERYRTQRDYERFADAIGLPYTSKMKRGDWPGHLSQALPKELQNVQAPRVFPRGIGWSSMSEEALAEMWLAHSQLDRG